MGCLTWTHFHCKSIQGVFLVAASLLLLFCNRSQAQTIQNSDLSQEFTLKTVPLGFGGAFRALAHTNDAILLNPAGLALRKGVVSIAGDYLNVGGTNATVLGVSVIDSNATEALSVGLAYDRSTPSIGGNEATIQQITLGLGHEISSLLFAGVSAKGYLTQVNSAFIDGPDGFDLDIGLLVKPLPILSLGITLQNLIRGNKVEEFPFQLGFGAALLLDPHLKLAFDLVKDFQTPNPNDLNAFFGGEFQVTEAVFLRSGFGLDRIRDNNFYSIGASLEGPKISLTFTFSQRLKPTNETYAANVEFYF